MNFFKMIVGWLRNFFNSKTDIGLAGGELIRDTKQSIANIEKQLNHLRASGLGHEKKIVTLKEKISSYKDAYQQHKSTENTELANKAKGLYESTYRELNNTETLLETINTNIASLEQRLRELRTDTETAKTQIETAAINQQVGKAANKVEDTFDSLGENGKIGELIGRSDKENNYAEARAATRKGNSDADVLAYKNSRDIPSIDD